MGSFPNQITAIAPPGCFLQLMGFEWVFGIVGRGSNLLGMGEVGKGRWYVGAEGQVLLRMGLLWRWTGPSGSVVDVSHVELGFFVAKSWSMWALW